MTFYLLSYLPVNRRTRLLRLCFFSGQTFSNTRVKWNTKTSNHSFPSLAILIFLPLKIINKEKQMKLSNSFFSFYYFLNDIFLKTWNFLHISSHRYQGSKWQRILCISCCLNVFATLFSTLKRHGLRLYEQELMRYKKGIYFPGPFSPIYERLSMSLSMNPKLSKCIGLE